MEKEQIQVSYHKIEIQRSLEERRQTISKLQNNQKQKLTIIDEEREKLKVCKTEMENVEALLKAKELELVKRKTAVSGLEDVVLTKCCNQKWLLEKVISNFHSEHENNHKCHVSQCAKSRCKAEIGRLLDSLNACNERIDELQNQRL